ncbi:hypothetical protein ACGFIF_16325 [Kribbella sp. NPDC049174]|uniref:hypothetical protein n=1 Tax=Kribbella sp. NPDC049174 TaxID=3364112 RepID=UPI0037232CE7
METAALIVAIVALAVSLSAFVFELISRRRQLLLTIYDKLLETEQQRGRRLVYELAESGTSYESLDESSRDCVNHALSTLNVLGFLYERRYVPRHDSLLLWGPAASRARRSAQICGFLDYWDKKSEGPVAPYLRKFAAAAESIDNRSS